MILQLMFSLAHLWSEMSLRDHALELLSTMLRRLDTLLVSDGSDMVFGQKRDVFTRIFSGCNMDQLTQMTTCLLKAPPMAVESKLGLFFIGRILECADDAEVRCVIHTRILLGYSSEFPAGIQKAFSNVQYQKLPISASVCHFTQKEMTQRR